MLGGSATGESEAGGAPLTFTRTRHWAFVLAGERWGINPLDAFTHLFSMPELCNM